MTVFADNVRGCQCKKSCVFPCWQREGIAEPCPECRCPRDLFPVVTVSDFGDANSHSQTGQA